MARNGSGSYSKVNTFVPGNTITASGHNQNWDDIATEMTNSVAADGQTTMTGALKASNGTSTAPALTFGADTDTGIYRKGANQLGFATAGTATGYFDTDGSLFVGAAGLVSIQGTATTFKLRNTSLATDTMTVTVSSDKVTWTGQQALSASTTSRASLNIPSGTAPSSPVAGDIWYDGTTFKGYAAGLTVAIGDPAAAIPGFLSGLELSTAGSSATFSVAAGGANDVAAAGSMVLASALAKTTSGWAVGNNQGALDTGAIATSTWYHVFLIKRVDTGVVDVLISLSASAPTMPTNYTLKRRIGAMKTNGSSQWTKFTQTGDYFIWDTVATDVNNIATVATRVNKVLTVPTGVVVKALMRFTLTSSGTTCGMMVTSLQESDQGPSTSNSAMNDAYSPASTTGQVYNFERLTDTSAQVGFRATGTANTYTVLTYGWVDFRGR